MAAPPELLSVPDSNLFTRLLIKKCLPRIKVFHEKIGAEQFIHDVIDFLAHGEFNQARYDAMSIEAAQLTTVFEGFKTFVQQCVGLDLSKEQVAADLVACGVSSDELQKFVITAIFSRAEEVKQKLAAGSVKLNKYHLVDFDWSVHLALAGDVIAQTKEPFLLLNLETEGSDHTRKKLILELTKADLDKLIEQLEKVNEEVTKLKF